MASNTPPSSSNSHLSVGLGVGLGLGIPLTLAIVCGFWLVRWRRQKPVNKDALALMKSRVKVCR